MSANLIRSTITVVVLSSLAPADTLLSEPATRTKINTFALSCTTEMLAHGEAPARSDFVIDAYIERVLSEANGRDRSEPFTDLRGTWRLTRKGQLMPGSFAELAADLCQTHCAMNFLPIDHSPTHVFILSKPVGGEADVMGRFVRGYPGKSYAEWSWIRGEGGWRSEFSFRPGGSAVATEIGSCQRVDGK